MRRWAVATSAIFCLAVSVATSLSAATIKLEDGTTISGEVLRVEDNGVALWVDRGSVKTIDGQVLPLPLKEGAAAPAFSVKDVAGERQTVGPSAEALTVLHFWVSWCPFCQTDAPAMQRLHERYREDARVRIVTVSLDEKREALDAFVKERGIAYPVISAAEQAKAPGGVDLPALYQIISFPITFLIDQHGVIRRKVSGSFVKGNIDLAADIQTLLP